MSMYQQICLQRYSIPKRAGYTFRPWKRLRFLEPLARWIWCRFGENHYEHVEGFRKITIDSDSIRELICESKHNLNLIAEDNCRHVIVGPEQFFELRDEFCKLSFDYKMPLVVNREITVYGLKVHVIPWFEGVLLLPELNEVREPNARSLS
jgi:hypothetical protein